MADITKSPVPVIESAQPLGKLTPAQQKERFDKLRQRMNKSLLEVKGKPGLHYFWAHKTDDSQIISFEGLGYWIVKEPNAKAVLAGSTKPEIEAPGLRQDGTYVRGDVILMACEQDIYDFIMLQHDQEIREMKRATTDDFRAEAEKVGAPTFEV